ncbi:type Z 30S ribosomal protein S14 [bacterium]|jgi:small subunit ribosomal protein S14|nr:type Z 30S ribosomal protein S14 [bacterium]
MAKTSMRVKNRRKQGTTQHRNRCNICGRPRGFLRFFGICRICFRTLASAGQLPGVRKSSW